MTLLSLDYTASLPETEPRKKGLLARVYGALYRARVAHVERLLQEYRPLLDDKDAQAETWRTYPFPVID